jgi:uncharacterized protein YdeI (YjbR/CyaY-like superfamily)
MGTRDPRVDAYIDKARDFAKPILVRLRELVHAGCPDVVEETKWGMPHFNYKGMFAGMAAFKAHCVFGFWKHELIVGQNAGYREAMGSFGRLRSLADLPPKKTFDRYVKIAMRLNDEGIQVPRRKHAKKKLVVPKELVVALNRNPKARKVYAGFSPSHQREYAEWIGEAKGEATRARRLATTIEWLEQGKHRNWKYESC